MPSDLDARFQQAAADAKNLPQRPSNDTLLTLYALYKQATAGDVTGKRPGMFKAVDRAKYDAWAEHKGTSQDAAKEEYVGLVEDLKNG